VKYGQQSVEQQSVPAEKHKSWISIKHLTTKSTGKHTAWSSVSHGGEYNTEDNKHETA
jgi:hypothetical protein